MRLVLLTLMLLAAFGVGQWYTASTSAQSKPKWEYQVIRADRIEGSGAGPFQVKGLSEMGEDGWEVAGVNDSWLLLKRTR